MNTDKPCPNGCGPLRWVDDQWYCPECGDEWPEPLEPTEPPGAGRGSAMDFNLARIRRLAIDVIAKEGEAPDEAFELAQRTQALDTLMQVGTPPPADWAAKQIVDGDALGEAARIALSRCLPGCIVIEHDRSDGSPCIIDTGIDTGSN